MGFMDLFRRRKEKKPENTGSQSAFPLRCLGKVVVSLKVDYDKPLSESLQKGDYGIVSEHLTEDNFPSTRSGVDMVRAELVYLGSNVEDEKAVLEAFSQMNLEPATIEELLALAGSYPKLHERFPVIALGSVWVADLQTITGSIQARNVPFLWTSGSRRTVRNIGTRWIGWGFEPTVRFLGIRSRNRIK